ncbi:hypothetical protein G6F70_003017 [Rhizopus microsporus]|nr:hypothetical protein G6F71_002321 [Rhizopus microsporus]KAG1201577.1 hypothetical protein G6F70_003017 [Rhizopus microsporus]KAG1214559.1 hypothetical protein G6F69_001791 [Rhizopus microsporus]KAG1238944.1 hypothetical protein G6F67_000042 [Rhizopus microsporus]KAG1267812.1 hypothetical protein G6F68_001617 [Rhizopus microsporus]
MSKVVTFVCQRAAHAIIAEAGSIRISNEGLDAINAFIDEFLFILLRACPSTHLDSIKTNIKQLLPNSLGKNALIEADMEISTIRTKPSTPLDVDTIRTACAHHCALSDYKGTRDVSNVIIVYLTVIIEHMAEYLLTSIAEEARAECIRVKDVILFLLNDSKVNLVFQKMQLKDQLQKKLLSYIRASSISTVDLEPEKSKTYIEPSTPRKSTESTHTQSTKTTSKSQFSLFGNKRKHSIRFSLSKKSSSFVNTLPSPTSSPLANDFEDLFRSGQTKKVSLTPHRLKTIEIVSPTPVTPIYHTSPPLTPASSLASRPSQRSKQSMIIEEEEEEEAKTKEQKTPTIDTNIIERPSSLVLKRASTGQRPPSFHEHVLLGGRLETQDQMLLNNRLSDELSQGLVYVVPPPVPIVRSKRRVIGIDKACQTDIEDEEEWFLDNCNSINSKNNNSSNNGCNAEQEQLIVEWLLG